jgi:thiol-disulfide isomerase/thioredoxin
MKKIILIICLLVISAIIMLAFKGVPQAKSADSKPSVSSEKQVVAYYFHGTFRCSSCLKIEQYSKEAIGKYFGNELKSGKLIFKVINVEEKGNEHYVTDYQLYTKSLVLSLVKDGKEIKSENLVKVWEHLGDRDKFYEYVKNNVDSYLKEL